VLNDSLLIHSLLCGSELLYPLARTIGEKLKKGGFI
jgi:hypothetical protein